MRLNQFRLHTRGMDERQLRDALGDVDMFRLESRYVSGSETVWDLWTRDSYDRAAYALNGAMILRDRPPLLIYWTPVRGRHERVPG